jgi:predicted RecB family nuclease
MDLEYDVTTSSHLIFGAGAMMARRNGETGQLWVELAETPSDELKLLSELARLLQRYSALPLLTWNGLGADLPQLGRAWTRHGLDDTILASARRRHHDLYQAARARIRLPLRSMRLGEVASHFGFQATVPDVDGMMMPILYRRYQDSKDRDVRATLRRNLLCHNEDDVRAVSHVWSAMTSYFASEPDQ